MAAGTCAELDFNLRFCVREDVAIEDFGDRSLVLLCESLQLREINHMSRRLLAHVNGERTIRDIALAIVSECATPVSVMFEQIGEALLRMERQGMVRRVVKLKMERLGQMNETTYLANPDVSFRQEDDDGGILFNADTDAVEVINPTAVAIWTFLTAPRTKTEVAAHLLEVCEGTPAEQVGRDVDEFVAALLKRGFIGVVEQA